jgi:predicted dehydrogenase
MNKPNIVIFGAGLIGQRHVEQAIAQAKLIAIVDPSDAARVLAEKHGVAYFADPEDCLASVTPDGVIVATPNHLHTEHALMCIARGIPVLIEKPIADTLENADLIASRAKAADVPVLVGHHRRHNPIVACAKAQIDSGALGDIVAVNGQFWLYKPDDYFQAAWRKGPGAGPAMINFIHDVDLLRYFCGNIADVQAMRSNIQRGQDVEDTAAIMLRFESGALGTFSMSDSIAAPWSWEMTSGENPIYPHRPGPCYTIGGTHASLSVPDLRLWAHDGPRSWWTDINATQLSVEHADSLVRQFAHFLAVINGTPPLVSAQEGRDSLAAVLDVLTAVLPGTKG